MTRIYAYETVYKSTVTVDGIIYQCSGVRGKPHRCHVSDGKRQLVFVTKPDRRWPFGPALRNHTIELFRKRTDARDNA